MKKSLLSCIALFISFTLHANDKEYDKAYQLRKTMHKINISNDELIEDETVHEARQDLKWHRETLLENVSQKDSDFKKLYTDAKKKYKISTENYSDGAASESFMKSCFSIDAYLISVTKKQKSFPNLYRNWHEKLKLIEAAELKSHKKHLRTKEAQQFAQCLKELQKLRQP
jgi:hypothetical protein